MITLKDIKPGDIIWAVDYKTTSPVILAWPIDTIETREGIVNNYWKFKVITESGERRTIHITEFADPDLNNDYSKPFNHVFETDNPDIVECYMLGLDRNLVYDEYVNKLKSSIQKVEACIREDHKKLVDYKTKLKAL